MRLKVNSELAGVFSLSVHGGRRGRVDFGESCNLILDQGIEYLLKYRDISAGFNAPYNRFSLGSGTTPPTPEQGSLVNRTVQGPLTSQRSVGYNSAGGYSWTRFTYQFGQGVAAGNHSEVGAGWGSGVGDLFSRALIVDGNGDPTTITVLPDEYLTVTYELRRWWNPAEPTVIEFDDDGTPAFTTAIANVPNASQLDHGAPQWAVLPLGVPSMSYDDSTAADGYITARALHSISQGNPSITGLYITSNLTDAGRNFAPKGTLFTFDPPIPKTNEFTVRIDVVLSLSRRG